jgi:hypothetical protein
MCGARDLNRFGASASTPLTFFFRHVSEPASNRAPADFALTL